MENTENHNFEKNIAAIRLSNPRLAGILSRIKEIKKDLQLVYNKANEPILTYNGTPLHSITGAEVEARNIFRKIENPQNAVHVVFGMGLGYLFQEFANKANGTVLLYEPDLEILRFTFELVDFSKELSKDNVKIVTDVEDLKRLIFLKYKYKSAVTFSSLPSYRAIYGEKFNELVHELQAVCGICLTTYNTTKMMLYEVTSCTVDNLPFMLNEIPLKEFKDKYKGKTAVIVSAGPTLDMNIETLKYYRDRYVLFAVGTAHKALLKNGIKPDFLNVVEAKNCFYQVQDTDLSDIYFIMEPSTYKTFHEVDAKMKISYFSNANPMNVAWAKLAGINTEGYDDGKGTVSYEAMASAKMLGFEKIILVGQDLAYVNNRCYSEHSVFSDLKVSVDAENKSVEIKPEDYEHYKEAVMTKNVGYTEQQKEGYSRYRIQQLNETVLFVKGIQGNSLPTEASYATFIEYFKEFAKENTQLKLINTSMIGAQIDGFENVTLDKALENEPPITEKVILTFDFKYNSELIKKNIDNEIKFLNNVFNEMSQNEKFFNQYDMAYNRTKSVNKDTNKYFKILLNYYSQLRQQASTSSVFFASLAFSEDLEMQYLLTKSEEVDEAAITEVYQALRNYYSVVKSRVRFIADKLRNARIMLG